MDLNTIAVNTEGSWMDILMPDGTETGIQFLVVGKDSDECKDGVQAQINNSRKLKKVSIDHSRKSNNEIVSSVVKAWRDKHDKELMEKQLISFGGEKLKCTKENKLRVFAEFPFIPRQVDEYSADDENFFTVSKPVCSEDLNDSCG